MRVLRQNVSFTIRSPSRNKKPSAISNEGGVVKSLILDLCLGHWQPPMDHSLTKTNKSVLDEELQKNGLPVVDIEKPSACIIDRMSVVQKIKDDHKSFAKIALLVRTIHDPLRKSRYLICI